MTFSQAQTACLSDGTTLTSITDAYEQAYVETQLHVMGDNPLWVGLVDDKVSFTPCRLQAWHSLKRILLVNLMAPPWLA